MKKAMVRPILVRGVAAFALLGALFGVVTQSASALPNPTVNLYVRAAGGGTSDTTPTHLNCGDGTGGQNGFGHACQTVSYAVGLAESLGGFNSYIIHVKHGNYFDTENNLPGGPASTPPGINITKNHMTIEKQGSGVVNIVPQTTEPEAGVLSATQQNVLVNVAPGVTNFLMKHVNLSGLDAMNSFTPGSQDYVGVYFPNSSGALSHVAVTNVQQPAAYFGDQPGANGSVYAAANTGAQTVSLSYVTANTYDKDGITCNGANVTCTIAHSTVTGQGPTNDNAQNGIEVAYGGTATITATTVTNNAYTCNGVDNASCYSASGILAYGDTTTTVSGSTVTANDVNIAAVSDTNPTTITNNTVSNATDAAVGSGQGIEVVSTTEGNITGNQITGNQGGGIGNYGTTGGTISGNTITGNSGSVAGTVPTVCATVSPCEVGGGIIDAGTTGGTIGGATANTISSNANGGVLLQGSSGGTVSNNTISNNAAGGVLLQVAFGATVSGNTLTSNASGGVVGEDPPPGTSPCTANPATSPCQNSGNQITGNTVSGTSGAAVQLTLTGGDTISGNGVSGLGEGGEGFIMVASDNNMVNTNTVSSSAAGVVITGNDLTGPSVNNTVSNNDFSANLLGGAAVDGFGSPESWNGPGRGDQGIEGEVFFQSGIAVGLGPTNGTGSPETVVTPTSFAGLPGAFSAVVEYLAGAGAICGSSGIPVDADGYTGPNPNLVACTDGTNIDIEGVVTVAITAGNGDATGPSTTLEPGCINPAPAGEGEPNCTGSVLTLSLLPSINTVAEGNSLTNNVWNNETIAGAIDGSGPNGQFTASSTPFTDSDPTPPGGIQNTWTGNTGSPGNSPADPNTADPAAGG